MSVLEFVLAPVPTILDRFNSQRYNTYVANAYSEEIRARVTAKKGDVVFKKAGIHIGEKEIGIEEEEKIEFHNTIRGFSKIKPGDYLSYNVAAEGLFKFHVYVSIVSGERIIADNFPVRNDHSVIVDEDGYVKHAKYGENWIDTRGRDHSPS